MLHRLVTSVGYLGIWEWIGFFGWIGRGPGLLLHREQGFQALLWVRTTQRPGHTDQSISLGVRGEQSLFVKSWGVALCSRI